MLGKRIQRARKALGLSLRELGDPIALSHAAIKKYEDDEVTPSSDVLIKLGKALHVRVEYFFRPERFTLENIHYRKHADMPERHLEEITAKILGIDNEQYPKIDGLYAEVNGMPVVVVGDQRPGDRQRFTLAHELGHLLLDNRLEDGLDIESCCNRFAGAFLLPKQSLVNVLGEHRTSIEPRELSLLKQEFGISMTSILHRLEETGIISSHVYRQLRAEFNERGWSKKEPGEQYPKEITHIFEQMIFHALAEQYIGESKAAELMNMPVKSFRSLRAMESQDVAHQ